MEKSDPYFIEKGWFTHKMYCNETLLSGWDKGTNTRKFVRSGEEFWLTRYCNSLNNYNNVVELIKQTNQVMENKITQKIPGIDYIENKYQNTNIIRSIESEVLFVQTHPDAILPFKNHPEQETGDAGYDLFAVETTTIPARGYAVVPVGLKLGYITPGYWFRVEARGGNGFKKNLEPHPGIVDNPYRGDLGIKLFNFSDEDQVIKKGNGAAQFILYKMVKSNVGWIAEEDVKSTDRNEKAFGSSDKK